MKDPIATGWLVVTLEELTETPKGDIVDGPFGSNLKASSYVATGVPIVRLQNIDRNRFIDKNIRFVTVEKAAELVRHSFRTGDIVVTKLGDPVGKACIVPPVIPEGIIVADVVRARIDPSIADARFVAYAINSAQVAAQLNLEVKGSTRPRVNLRHIRELEIPLAPIAEQRCIVVKLGKLLEKVDACLKRLAKIPVLLRRFRQSVLDAACSGNLTADWRERSNTVVESEDLVESQEGFPTLPTTWGWRPLQSVCEEIADCPHSTPKWTDAGRLCVRTTNFRPGLLDLSEVRYVSESSFEERTVRVQPKPGDILYSREGGILGIACIIPESVDLCLGQRMMLFRVNGTFTNVLLMHWLNSSPILNRVRDLTGGSASPHLNVRDIKNFPIPCPPPSEQIEIVRRVDELFALADQVEANYAKATQYVDSLKESILAKAFRGELVPQDPNDEPAEVLLERIREARVSQHVDRSKQKGAGRVQPARRT
jgi:type I restriction enzyme, S subunit